MFQGLVFLHRSFGSFLGAFWAIGWSSSIFIAISSFTPMSEKFICAFFTKAVATFECYRRAIKVLTDTAKQISFHLLNGFSYIINNLVSSFVHFDNFSVFRVFRQISECWEDNWSTEYWSRIILCKNFDFWAGTLFWRLAKGRARVEPARGRTPLSQD